MRAVVLVLTAVLILGLLWSLIAERRHDHPLSWTHHLSSLRDLRDHAAPGSVQRPVLALGLVFLVLALLAPAMWRLVS